METSIRLDAGAYGIRAQRAVSRTSISFRIDQLAPRRPRRTVVLDLAALRDYAS